jgi:methylated-DNA-[protein]-cysteine S-methyltransferase
VSQANVKVSPQWLRAAGRHARTDVVRGAVTLHHDSFETTSRIYCASFEAPIGVIYIASTDRGLCKIALPKDGKASFFGWIKDNFAPDGIVDDRKKNSNAIRQLNEYFIGKRTKFDLDIDLIGTNFQQRVWTDLTRIPYGTVVTYKQIARHLHTKGFRTVGTTIGKNPVPIVLPCHRVVGSDSRLVGYAGGIRLKEYLLRLEGILLI